VRERDGPCTKKAEPSGKGKLGFLTGIAVNHYWPAGVAAGAAELLLLFLLFLLFFFFFFALVTTWWESAFEEEVGATTDVSAAKAEIEARATRAIRIFFI
jgi:hypothetical protein